MPNEDMPEVSEVFPHVVEARCVRDHVIWLEFSDGLEGEVDLKDELWGPVFELLKDLNRFRQFSVHRELHTIVWDNGADFAPEFLHHTSPR